MNCKNCGSLKSSSNCSLDRKYGMKSGGNKEGAIQWVDDKLKNKIGMTNGVLNCQLHPGSCGLSQQCFDFSTLCQGVWVGKKKTGPGCTPLCPNRFK